MYSARDGHDEDLPCRAGLIILSARVGPRTLAAIEQRGSWHWSSALSRGLRALLDCLCGARLIGGAAARHLPDDPRQLVGERHHRDVPPLAREQMPRPARQWVAVAAVPQGKRQMICVSVRLPLKGGKLLKDSPPPRWGRSARSAGRG